MEQRHRERERPSGEIHHSRFKNMVVAAAGGGRVHSSNKKNSSVLACLRTVCVWAVRVFVTFLFFVWNLGGIGSLVCMPTMSSSRRNTILYNNFSIANGTRGCFWSRWKRWKNFIFGCMCCMQATHFEYSIRRAQCSRFFFLFLLWLSYCCPRESCGITWNEFSIKIQVRTDSCSTHMQWMEKCFSILDSIVVSMHLHFGCRVYFISFFIFLGTSRDMD